MGGLINSIQASPVANLSPPSSTGGNPLPSNPSLSLWQLKHKESPFFRHKTEPCTSIETSRDDAVLNTHIRVASGPSPPARLHKTPTCEPGNPCLAPLNTDRFPNIMLAVHNDRKPWIQTFGQLMAGLIVTLLLNNAYREGWYLCL